MQSCVFLPSRCFLNRVHLQLLCFLAGHEHYRMGCGLRPWGVYYETYMLYGLGVLV